MSKSVSLTEGKLAPNILALSLPLVLSNILQVLFNMSDIAVVGRFAGSKALGAVGSTAITVMLFTGILIGMAGGVNVIVARAIGSGNRKDTEQAVHAAFVVCLITGICVMLFGLFFSRPLLELLGTKKELIDGAVLYLRIYSVGMPALSIYNFGNAVWSAAGNSKKPLLFLAVSGVVNVALNLFLVIVIRMDVDGVAIASISSMYISSALVLVSLIRSPDSHHFSFRKLGLYPIPARQIVALGVPAALQNSIFAIANLFVQAGVNTFDTKFVEGSSAAANADTLAFDVMAAVYTACSSFMSQNYGAGKPDRVIKSYFICLAYSFGIGAILGVLFSMFGMQFLMLFTTDVAVAEAGMLRLAIMAPSYCLSAFMDCTIAASRGIGKSVAPTIIVIMGSCVFRVIWVYTIFAHFNTIGSLYSLYACSWALTAIFEIAYFIYAWRQVRTRFKVNSQVPAGVN